MFFVYVLLCRDGSLYTGYTNNLEKRLKMHNFGKAAKYTRSRRPVKLVYCHHYKTKSEAMRAEASLKRLRRPEKLRHLKTCNKNWK